VQELTDEYRQKMNISEREKGVVVSNIAEDSPALGVLNKGDVVLEIRHKPVTDVKEYNKIVSGIENNSDVLMLIVKNGVRQYVTIPAKNVK